MLAVLALVPLAVLLPLLAGRLLTAVVVEVPVEALGEAGTPAGRTLDGGHRAGYVTRRRVLLGLLLRLGGQRLRRLLAGLLLPRLLLP